MTNSTKCIALVAITVMLASLIGAATMSLAPVNLMALTFQGNFQWEDNFNNQQSNEHSDVSPVDREINLDVGGASSASRHALDQDNSIDSPNKLIDHDKDSADQSKASKASVRIDGKMQLEDDDDSDSDSDSDEDSN